MILADTTLNELLRRLTADERRAVSRHLAGLRTRESWALVRRIRASLKRRARARLPRKLVWLG